MWFTRSVIAETVIEPTPQEQYEQNRSELAKLGQELAAAERAIMEHTRVTKDPRVHFVYQNGHWNIYTRLNAMTLDPALQKLEGRRAEILRMRAVKLSEHARLKQLCGELLRRRP